MDTIYTMPQIQARTRIKPKMASALVNTFSELRPLTIPTKRARIAPRISKISITTPVRLPLSGQENTSWPGGNEVQNQRTTGCFGKSTPTSATHIRVGIQSLRIGLPDMLAFWDMGGLGLSNKERARPTPAPNPPSSGRLASRPCASPLRRFLLPLLPPCLLPLDSPLLFATAQGVRYNRAV